MGAGNVKYPSIGLLSEDEDEGHEGEEDSEEVQAEQTTMLEPFGDEDDNDERGGGVHSGADDSDDDEEGDSEDESEGEQQGKETRPSVEMDMDLCSIQSNGTEMSPACVAGSMSGSVMSGLASASSLPFVTPREGEEEYEEGIERAFDESESLETVGIESAKVVPVETVTTIPICSQQEDADEGLLTGGDFLLEEASYDCGSTLDAAVQASAAEVEGEGMRGRRRLRRRRSRTIRQPPASVISELSNDGSRSGGDSTTVMSVANPSKQVQAGEEARQTVLSDIPSQYSAADSISSPGVDTCGPRSVSQDCSDRARAEQAAKNLLLEEKVKALKSQLNALERQAAAATAPTPTPSLRKRQSGMRVPMTKAKTKSKIRQRDAPPVKSMLELGGDSAPAPVPAPAPTRSGGGASALARVNSRFGPAGVEVKSSRRRGAYGVLKRMRPVATNSPARSRTEIAEADENIQVAKPRKSAAQSAAGPIGLKQRNRNRIRAEKISPQITSLQSQPSADPLIVQEWGDDDVRERQWSASLDSRWAEVEFMMRRRIEAEEDLTYNIRAAELGLAYMQKLEDKALQLGVRTGQLSRWLLPYDLDTSVGDQRVSTPQTVLSTMPSDLSQLCTEEEIDDLAQGARCVRGLVRIKIADDNDLKTAADALSTMSSFFQRLVAEASRRDCTPYQVLQERRAISPAVSRAQAPSMHSKLGRVGIGGRGSRAVAATGPAE